MRNHPYVACKDNLGIIDWPMSGAAAWPPRTGEFRTGEQANGGGAAI